MWLSQFVDFLKSSRAALLGLPSSRPASRPRPPAVEPLEDRLLLTGQVAMDLTPGTHSLPQPPVIMTIVLQVAVNMFDLGWPQPAANTPAPDSTGNNGGMDRSSGISPKGDLLTLGLPSLPALGVPAVGTGKGGAHGATAAVPPAVIDAALVTPAKIDAYFQHPTAVGSF